MIYIFYDKYCGLEDMFKIEANSKKEALLKVINEKIDTEEDIKNFCDSIDWGLMGLDEFQNVE